MINLLGKIESIEIPVYRRLIVTATTGILVIYIIGVAGVLGWWGWLGRQQTRVSSEVTMFEENIKKLAITEVLYRQVTDRTDKLQEILNTRVSAAALAATIDSSVPGVVVNEWTYDAQTDTSTIGLVSSQAMAIQDQVTALKTKFGQVIIVSLSRQKDPLWTAVISLGKRKS